VLEILLGVLLRLSHRVRVGVGAGVWLSQTSALFAHRREATFSHIARYRAICSQSVLNTCPTRFLSP
jgi:hypothetical protein